jgi:hypothetical protein
MILSEPIPFRDALQSRAVKKVLPTNLTSAELMQLDAAIREKAMFSAQTLLEDYLKDISKKVETILNPVSVDGRTEGMDTATARLQLKEQLRSLGYSPDPDKRGTIEDLSSDQRINLVLKMNVEMAQGYGDWRQSQDPAVLDQFPAQELFRGEDRKEPRDWMTRWRGAGGQLYGGRMIALKNDPIWTELSAFGLPYPPFDFNSGMWVRDVDRDEAVQLGLIDQDTQIQPQSRGFEMAA